MRFIISIVTILILNATVAYTGTWEKYTSTDSTFSFHYPAGWTVKPDESTLEIENPAADEQLAIVFMAYDKSKSPTEIAKDIITFFKSSFPDFLATNWQSEPDTAETSVTFQIGYSEKTKRYTGNAIVLKSGDQVYWFSFSGPVSGYSQTRALKILEGLITSIASGSDSKEPPFDVPKLDTSARQTAQQMQKNADAFIFVLEFSLGAPLSAADEKIIQTELKKNWATNSTEELKPYSEYPSLVKSILSADADQITQLHSTLEASIKEWLSENDDTDPAVKIIRNKLDTNGNILAEEAPGLSELAVESYSEMIAFAELLYNNPKSTLEQISQAKLATIRKSVISSWSRISEQERNNIASTPAIWITIRQLMKFGTVEEQKKMRSTVRGLWAPAAKRAKIASTPSTHAGSSSANGSTKKSTQDEVSKSMMSNLMMKSQQHMFNTYMWSRGYAGWTPMGKLQ